MNALEYIEQEHRRLRQSLERIRATLDPSRRHRLYADFCGEIRSHLHQQQAVFYVALSGYAELQATLAQSFSSLEHIQDLVSEIERHWDLPKSSHRLELLAWNLEQHFQREECEIFPRVRKILHEPRLERLGALLAVRAAGNNPKDPHHKVA